MNEHTVPTVLLDTMTIERKDFLPENEYDDSDRIFCYCEGKEWQGWPVGRQSTSKEC